MSGLGLEDGSREEAVAFEEVDGDTAELERFRLRDMTDNQCNYELTVTMDNRLLLNAEEDYEMPVG